MWILSMLLNLNNHFLHFTLQYTVLLAPRIPLNIFKVTLSQKQSESLHENGACHGWSTCNKKYMYYVHNT